MEENKEPQAEEPKLRKARIRVKSKQTDKKYFFKKSKLLKTYNTYCRGKQIRKVDKVKKEELEPISGEIFRTIQRHLIEREGGVMIRNFGYFGTIRVYGNKTKRFGKNKEDVLFTPHNNGMRLRIIYFPYKRDPLLKYWTMDFNFSSKIYNTIRDNISKGKNYKSYFFSLRKLLGDNIESPYHIPRRLVKVKKNE